LNRRSPAPEAGGLNQAILHPALKCPVRPPVSWRPLAHSLSVFRASRVFACRISLISGSVEQVTAGEQQARGIRRFMGPSPSSSAHLINCSHALFLAASRPKSAQRESNPRFRHGKAVGYHYNMGTCDRSRIVNESESTGWDSNPRRRITGAESSPLNDQCDNHTGTRGARTLTHLVKSQALCH
jgi:hypothetical protein